MRAGGPARDDCGGPGAILNIASVHADQTFKGHYPYAAAKSGLIGLNRSLALEVAPHQIRVNALLPGWTETALVADQLANAPPGTRDTVIAPSDGPHRHPGQDRELCRFPSVGQATFVTGANWRVDGGPGARFAD